MKKYIIIILISGSIFLASCIKFKEDDTNHDSEAIDTTGIVNPESSDSKAKENTKGAVYIYNDSLGIPVKKNNIGDNADTPVELTNIINKYNGDGKINLEFIKTSSDTVYVKIEDSAYLTQQMGTLGAHSYLSAVTFTFTELKGLNYVNFNFKEGDHASPGTYSRKSFSAK